MARKLSRRNFLYMAAAGAAGLVLSACGDGSAPPEETTAAPIIKEEKPVTPPAAYTSTPMPTSTPKPLPVDYKLVFHDKNGVYGVRQDKSIDAITERNLDLSIQDVIPLSAGSQYNNRFLILDFNKGILLYENGEFKPHPDNVSPSQGNTIPRHSYNVKVNPLNRSQIAVVLDLEDRYANQDKMSVLYTTDGGEHFFKRKLDFGNINETTIFETLAWHNNQIYVSGAMGIYRLKSLEGILERPDTWEDITFASEEGGRPFRYDENNYSLTSTPDGLLAWSVRSGGLQGDIYLRKDTGWNLIGKGGDLALPDSFNSLAETTIWEIKNVGDKLFIRYDAVFNKEGDSFYTSSGIVAYVNRAEFLKNPKTQWTQLDLPDQKIYDVYPLYDAFSISNGENMVFIGAKNNPTFYLSLDSGRAWAAFNVPYTWHKASGFDMSLYPPNR